MKELTVYVTYDSCEYTVSTYKGAYRNLMELINDNIYIDNFGECGGMGRCATCIIEAHDANANLTDLDRNEEATLTKIGSANGCSRLSCQLMVDEYIDGIRITISV